MQLQGILVKWKCIRAIFNDYSINDTHLQWNSFFFAVLCDFYPHDLKKQRKIQERGESERERASERMRKPKRKIASEKQEETEKGQFAF